MNFLRNACTAAYRIIVVMTLVVIASELARTNQLLYSIGSMIFKVLGAPTT